MPPGADVGAIAATSSRRMVPETRTAESLDGMLPTPGAAQCQVKHLHVVMKVYSKNGVSTRTLDDAAYAHHLQRGELAEALPWMTSLLSWFGPERDGVLDPPD